MRKISWAPQDREEFRNHNILRAQTIPAKKFDGPQVEEWDEDED